jgi:Family of unknown function (DUF5984)
MPLSLHTASVIRFRFQLYPLQEVSPWGAGQPELHWFGLTDGWYWLEVDGQQLLRRARVDDRHPYVDYQVVRLWEDVLLVTPDALEAVPADLQPFVASDPGHWACDPFDFISDEDAGEDADPDAPDHPAITASNWHGQHYLDLGYLLNAPRLRFWRTAQNHRDEITVDWRHDDRGEIPFTAGPAARFRVPTSEYLEAVHTLDRELMTAMRQRVEELERLGGLPGVNIDLAGLRQEHEGRVLWLAKALNRSRSTDWEAVRKGARLLLGEAEQARPRRAGSGRDRP